MVLPTNLNEDQFHGRTFKGYVQFQEPDGSVWFRMKERQAMTFNMSYTMADHYTDDGRKIQDPAGHNHTFSMPIKVTSDMFDDTTWTYTNGILDDDLVIDKETLSYWIYKLEINKPIIIIFVVSMEMLTGPSGSSTSKNINFKFRLQPSSFGTGLGNAGGAPTITVGGTVLSITSALRSTTTEQ